MNGWGLFPQQASAYAVDHDRLFFAMVALTGIVAVSFTVVTVLFLFRYYHRRATERRLSPHAGNFVEYSWTVVLLLLFVGVFAWAATLYARLFYAPADAMTVYVIGKQWMWKTQHPGGRREYNELHVPAGRPVKLFLTSEDVIHSFFVPALRIKRDAVPGRYNTLWFRADTPGEYHLLCTEYCGAQHAKMAGRLVVMPPTEFAAWIAAGPHDPLARQGELLFRRSGCSGCHGVNASVRAPPLEAVFGKPVALADGSVVLADERYLRDSILFPRRQVVAGYDPIMPSFQGRLTEEEILQLVTYLQSLAGAPAP